MTPMTVTAAPARWELAAETIAIKIRWFGVLVGYLLGKRSVAPVEVTTRLHRPTIFVSWSSVERTSSSVPTATKWRNV